jgi:hypothetical protein
MSTVTRHSRAVARECEEAVCEISTEEQSIAGARRLGRGEERSVALWRAKGFPDAMARIDVNAVEPLSDVLHKPRELCSGNAA